MMIGSMHDKRRKLTPEQVQEIRTSYADSDTTQATLAHKYGVTIMAISYIVRRKTWGWL